MDEIVIRAAVPEDAGRLLEIYTYYVEHTAITFEWDVPMLEVFEKRICQTLMFYPYLVIERNGRIEGYAYAGPFKGRTAYDWSCEVTIYIDRHAHKLGLGRRLYDALEHELARMGILNLYACIGYPECEDEYLTRNSADFHSHLGYRLAGQFHKCGYKFGRWYDMIWMEKMIGDHLDRQPAVLPHQILDSGCRN